MASIYTPGMTIDQFRAKLQADPGFQQLVSSAARLPNGQFTPQAGLAISRYAQASGLNDLNIAQIHTGDPHRSTYSIDGNGGILEQHDGKGPEFWGPIIVGAVSGGAIAAPYLVGAAGAEGAGAAGGATSATGTTAGAGTLASTATVPTVGGLATGGTGLTGAGAVGAGGSTVATSAIPWGQVISTGIGSTSNLYGGKSAANAQKEGAALQAKAISDAAALQKQTADATLAFEKDQATQTRADNITAQNANFGQWGYRQNVIRPYQGTGLQAENTLAQMLGLPAVNTRLPDLPPAPVFSSTGTTPSSGSTANGPAPNVDGSAASISAYYKSRGVDPATTAKDVPYWVSKWPELVARGQELGDPSYPMKRLSQGDVFMNGGQSAPQTIGSYAGMPPTAPTPAGTGTTLPFIPLNLGGYAGVQA